MMKYHFISSPHYTRAPSVHQTFPLPSSFFHLPSSIFLLPSSIPLRKVSDNPSAASLYHKTTWDNALCYLGDNACSYARLLISPSTLVITVAMNLLFLLGPTEITEIFILPYRAIAAKQPFCHFCYFCGTIIISSQKFLLFCRQKHAIMTDKLSYACLVISTAKVCLRNCRKER